ncbi:hypothetical protein J1N35_043925 [Gossypium stocksii]|uniref:Reverse transcriptase zinc-binding domain-containing protein n=1 Tax=Gossypium stocksii TaxID=47602 RepID=A0A9D3U806_9ROSI|nr:hypothetical protein J1N35_043925 [Gossypium stocksii]
MVKEDGSWNLDLFRIWLLEEVIEVIMGIPPPIPSEEPDRIIWCHTSSGDFSIKSAYKICKGDEWNAKDDKWKCVWKTLGPQRVRFFIWLVLKQRILSNVERVKRGLAVDPSCFVCGSPIEDILHILRNFNIAKDVWSQVITGNRLTTFFSLNLQYWILLNVQDTSVIPDGGSTWAGLFGMVKWRLWKNRNLFIFQGQPWSSREIVNNALCWATQWYSPSRVTPSGGVGSPLEEQAFESMIVFNTEE